MRSFGSREELLLERELEDDVLLLDELMLELEELIELELLESELLELLDMLCAKDWAGNAMISKADKGRKKRFIGKMGKIAEATRYCRRCLLTIMTRV